MSADTSDPALLQALQEVKNPKSNTNWVLFGYEKQTTKVKVFKTGSGGFAEMVDEMSEAKALFAFVRFTIRGVNKFLYMSWCGEGVPGVVKGRFGGHIRDMERFLTGFHVQINARTEKDLDEKTVIAKLDKAMGANFDAGQKEQGQKKGGVTTVAEGLQKVQNPKQKEIKKTDEGNVGLDQRNQFWQKVEAEPAANAEKGYKPVREDPAYKANQQRDQFWKQQEAAAPAPAPVAGAVPKADYNKKAESSAYWDKVNADQEAAKAGQGSTAAPVASSLGARNVKAQFEQRAANVNQPPPPRAAPPQKPVGRVAAPPPPQQHYEEPQQPAHEEQPQAHEEQPQAHEEQPAAHEEQPQQHYEEQPQHTEEQPAAHEEQPQQHYEEQPPAEPAPAAAAEQPAGQQAKALFDYAGEAEGDLAFAAGSIINVLDTSDPSGWWQGELNGVTGVFPSNFVELVQ